MKNKTPATGARATALALREKETLSVNRPGSPHQAAPAIGTQGDHRSGVWSRRRHGA